MGISSPSGILKNTPPLLTLGSAPKSRTHTEPISALMLNRCPHLVRCTPLMATPNPAATKNTPNISAPAAGFHLTHADNASASSARMRIHTQDPKNSPQPRLELACIHVQPSSRY